MMMTANAAVGWTDVGGLYYLDGIPGTWRQVITGTSMPSTHVGPDHTGQDGNKSSFLGCYAAAIAPSNPSRIIFGFDGYLFGSDDKGVTNIALSLPQQKMQSNSGASRLNNNKAAFHPTNPNTWIFSTADSVFYSTTGFSGAPTQVTGLAAIVPADDSAGMYVGIDSTGKTYIAVRGTGVYSLASVSGTPTLTTSGPVNVNYLFVDSTTNIVWCCDEAGTVWKFSGSSWTQVTVPNEMLPTNNPPTKVAALGSNVALFGANGNAAYSSDSGASFVHWWPASISYSSSTIPYLNSGASPGQIFPGGMQFRPGQAKELWVSHGTGVCSTVPPASGNLTLTDKTVGIEELVANQALWTSGGRIITTFWDKGFNDRTEATISNYMASLPLTDFAAGWSVDGDDNLAVVLCSWDAVKHPQYSQSGGAWADLPHIWTDAGKGGCVGVNGNEIIIAPSNDSSLPLLWTSPTATPITLNFSGGRTTGDMGWGHAYYNDRQIIAADRQVAGTFYLYCAPTNDNVGRGFYKRTAGQTALTFISAGPAWFQSMFRFKLKAVRGHAGHLFATPGSGLARMEKFYRTEDGCQTWIEIPNVTDLTDFDFTPTLAGNTYPSVEFYGRVNGGSPGLYVCDNIQASTPTYRLLDPLPGNSFDAITCLTCSPTTYGRRIIGHSGTGFLMHPSS